MDVEQESSLTEHFPTQIKLNHLELLILISTVNMKMHLKGQQMRKESSHSALIYACIMEAVKNACGTKFVSQKEEKNYSSTVSTGSCWL